VVGLEVGADDYVAKPCALAELRARIEPPPQAWLSRTFGAAHARRIRARH
jgi:DNA-binding response OmpR family regulator